MQTYRSDIDGLRMMAVVPVVLYHAGIPGFSGGFIGVDIFFVISGYLITRILNGDIINNNFSIVRFYERRTRRIIPALIFMIAVSYLIATFVLLPKDMIDFSRSVVSTIFFVSNFLFWRETGGYFDPATDFAPLLHTWSLAVEEQFYIFTPLLFWVLASSGVLARRRAILFVTFLSFAIAAIGVFIKPQAVFYLAPARAWELGAGSLLALSQGFASKSRPAWLLEVLSIGGFCLLAVPVFVYDSHTVFPGLTALAPVLGTVLIIWTGTAGNTALKRMLSLPLFVYVGLISYSLYLWHWPLLAFARHYYGTVEIPQSVALMIVALSFPIAWFSWAFVERPFRRPAPEGFGSRFIFLSGGAAMVTTAAMGLVFWQGAGLPQRLPDAVTSIAAAAQDTNPYQGECFNIRPDEGLCTFGVNPTATDADFLLWGDSHADAAMPAFVSASQEANKTGRFAGRPGCAPLLGINRADQPSGYDCAGFTQSVLSYLEERDDMPIVFLMARWTLAAEGARIAGEHGDLALLMPKARSSDFAPAIETNFSLYEDALKKTVDAIRATGRSVVVVGNVPELGWDVPRRTAVHQLWGHPLPQTPSSDSLKSRHQRAEEVLSRVSQEDEVSFLELVPLVCDPQCKLEKNGILLYADDNHLTRFGAEELLRSPLNAILERD